MLPEDYNDNRYYELWTATSLNGPWTKIVEKWASYHNLTYNSDHWTDNVSHGEIIRAGVNQKLEIDDIARADFLIQGVVNGSYPDYAQIPWELGVIRNYNVQTTPTPTPTITPMGDVVVSYVIQNDWGSGATVNVTIINNGSAALTVNFGFNLTYSGTNAKPTSGTLNGTACKIQ
jgi:hypothetical protein